MSIVANIQISQNFPLAFVKSIFFVNSRLHIFGSLGSKKLSEKVIEVCHIPGKGHEILVTSCAIGPFPEYFWTQL